MFSIQPCIVLAAFNHNPAKIVDNLTSFMPENIKQSLVPYLDANTGEHCAPLENFANLLNVTASHVYNTPTYTESEIMAVCHFHNFFISILYEVINSRERFDYCRIVHSELELISTTLVKEFKVWLKQVLSSSESIYGWVDRNGQDSFVEYRYTCLSEFYELLKNERFISRYTTRREKILNKEFDTPFSSKLISGDF